MTNEEFFQRNMKELVEKYNDDQIIVVKDGKLFKVMNNGTEFSDFLQEYEEEDILADNVWNLKNEIKYFGDSKNNG